MHKKRCIPLVLFGAISLVITTACGAGGSGSSGSKGAVEISFMSFWNTSGRDEVGAPMIEAFEKSHPNIKVKLITQPYSDYLNKALTLGISKSLPDVITPQPSMTPTLMNKGLLRPLDEFISKEHGYKESFPPGALVQMKGHQYYMPIGLIPTGFFYNIDLLQKAGIQIPEKWTWENFRAAAEKVNDPPHGIYATAFSLCQKEAANVAVKIFPFMYQAGGELFDQSGKPDLTSPENVQGVKYWVSLINDGLAMPGTNSNCNDQTEGAFVAGNTAFQFQNSSVAGVLRSQASKMQFGFADLEGPGGPNPAVRLSDWQVAMSADTEHPEEAWEFIKWMTTTHDGEISKVGGLVPAYRDAQQESWVQSDPITKKAAELNARPKAEMVDLLLPNPDAMYKAFAVELQGVVSKEKSVEQALEAANTEWMKYVK